MGEKRNDQLIAWGIGIIGTLLGLWLAGSHTTFEHYDP
jgi:hypothetical protein